MSPARNDELRWYAPAMLCAQAVAVALLAWSWSRLEGYLLADAVEFMDRARSLVRGEGLGSAEAVRSFAFSLVFVPVFGAFEVLGSGEARAAVWVVRLVQMALALGMLQAVARLAERLFGRPAGIAAAWLVAANPAWMLYGVAPVSDLAAGLCIARALGALVPREDRRPLAGGLWLGAALLVTYKTLPVGLAALLLLLARDLARERARGLRPLGLALAGLGAGAAVQVVLDRIVYGRWGVSLGRYLVENVGGVLGRVALELRLERLAVAIYDTLNELRGWDYTNTGRLPPVQQRLPPTWYVENVTQMLVVPVLALLAIAAARWVRRPRWDAAVLAGAFALDVVMLSTKGSKSFRLWVSLLPLVVPLAAWGWAAVWSVGSRRVLARAAAVAVLLASVALGVAERAAAPSAVHGGYWRAAEAARAAAGPGGPDEPPRFASAYPWATFQRGGGALAWQRFAYPLEAWGVLGREARAELAGELEALDLFAVHLPLLTEQPELLELVNARFAVAAAFYDQERHAELGPVFLLARADDAGGDRRFFRVGDARSAEPPGGWRTLPPSTRFAGGGQELVLLGWQFEALPADRGDRHGWLTYWWTSPTGLAADHRFLDRLTAPDERNAWQNNHDPAYGVHPTSTWRPGAIVRESHLFVAGAEAMFADRPFRPLGGAYRRGDLVPLRLWMMVSLPEGEATLEPSLAATPPEPAPDPGSELAAAARRDRGRLRRTPPGYTFSADGLVEVGGFLAPVPPRARVPDDGRPIPD